jgi:hypothetical protein
LIYEGDVIHHFKATDISYMMIAITFVSYFISSFQRRIKPPVKLGTAKRNPNFERREKNEAIICRNYLPHHEHVQNSPITFSPCVVEI